MLSSVAPSRGTSARFRVRYAIGCKLYRLILYRNLVLGVRMNPTTDPPIDARLANDGFSGGSLSTYLIRPTPDRSPVDPFHLTEKNQMVI